MECFTKYSDINFKIPISNFNKESDFRKFKMADSIIEIFKDSFSDITIFFDKNDYSIKVRNDESNYIHFTAGLVRSIYIEKEGLIIILAHELGHIYGIDTCNVTCKNIDCSNCEGRCILNEQLYDYCATNVIIPKICKKSIQKRILDEGVIQIKNFITKEQGYNQIGYHKDTICRVATYISGYNLQPIPICKKIYCK